MRMKLRQAHAHLDRLSCFERRTKTDASQFRGENMALKRIFMLTMALLLWVGGAAAQEAKIKFKDLPPAVQETAKAQSEGATVRGYAKEIEKGKTEYEVQLTVDGKKRDVSIDPNGKVLETEQEVAFESVP